MEKQYEDSFDHKRAIVVLSEHDIEKIQMKGAPDLINEEVYILKSPLVYYENMPNALKNIYDSDLARPGAILVQNPYDKTIYDNAINAPQNFALAKYMYFSEFSRLLGAKKVIVDQLTIKTTKGIQVYGLSINTAPIKVDSSINSEQIEQLRAQLSLEDEFSGGNPDLVAAEKLLRQYNLYSDPNLKSLLELRKDGNNTLVSRKLTINLSTEAKQNLNVAANIKIPTYLTTINSEYKQTLQQKNEFSVTMRVNF